jgi:hypothetical protein
MFMAGKDWRYVQIIRSLAPHIGTSVIDARASDL